MKNGTHKTAMAWAASFVIGAGLGALMVAQIDSVSTTNLDGRSAKDRHFAEQKAREDASIQSVDDVQAVRGIEGIDTVMLQNLEAVLRMQDRPQEDQGKGGAKTAATLMTLEPSEELEETPDARDEHLEFELEGS